MTVKRAKQRAPREVTLRDIFGDLGVLDQPAIDQEAVVVMLRTPINAMTLEEAERSGNVAHIGPELGFAVGALIGRACASQPDKPMGDVLPILREFDKPKEGP